MPANLSELRALMREHGLRALIVGSEDAHNSEYVAESDARRAFVSGFTGSAGTALVTLEAAFLWTDGRYWLQASQQLSAEWTLMKTGEPGVPSMQQWLEQNLSAGEAAGVDPFTISTASALSLKAALEAKNVQLTATSSNLVDQVWADRPAVPATPIRVHDLEYAGVHHSDKIAELQADLANLNASALVVCALDEVAWLLNIRGADIQCNPVSIAYVVVTRDNVHAFVNSAKLGPEVQAHLGDKIQILPYENITSFLAQFSSESTQLPVVADHNNLNWAVYQAIKVPVTNTPSLIERKKTVKNDKEIEGIRQAHIRDGVALTAFIAWLERTLHAGPEGNGDGLGWPLSECAVATKLQEMRASMDKFVGLSFDTISGYGSNGAIIHYRAQPETCKNLGTAEMFLLDSGAQYLDGTTDITRTMHFGEPTEYQKECFTRVLQGHIALAQFKFPEGTTGTRFDAIARAPLWAVGLDYKHGTGHGVGAHLNVHEGPQGISFRYRPNEMGFVAGMTVSNEPGYYEEGQFGIRIENIMVTKQVETTYSFGGYKFCGFDTVSFCPIQTRLVIAEMLSDAELAWLNAYHHEVRAVLTPLMQEKFPEALDFLHRETEPIQRA